MSSFIFVQHLDQLAGLIRRYIAVPILKIQDNQLSCSCVNDVRTFPARPDETDNLGRLARVRESNAFGAIADPVQQFFASRHRG